MGKSLHFTFKFLTGATYKALSSLIVCNLLVVVTCFYRSFKGGEDIESDVSPSAPTTAPTVQPSNMEGSAAQTELSYSTGLTSLHLDLSQSGVSGSAVETKDLVASAKSL